MESIFVGAMENVRGNWWEKMKGKPFGGFA
jgi:hypothetical protein